VSLPVNQIICGDALETMQTFPRNSIDLVLTDPPFFTPTVHYQSRIKFSRIFADVSPLRIFWYTITREVVRILKKTGHFMTFCNCDSYPVFYAPIYDRFDKVKSLVWDKTEVGLGRIFRHQHELIIWARNEGHKYNHIKRVVSDVIKARATRTENRVHPVEKPVKLMKQLIEPVTFEDDVVLDPFCGSGTALLGAYQLKRNWIGIDLNQKYAEEAKKKMEKYTLCRPILRLGER